MGGCMTGDWRPRCDWALVEGRWAMRRGNVRRFDPRLHRSPSKRKRSTCEGTGICGSLNVDG